MIFFVWSLVLSAVQFAQRQRLVSILSEYFVWNLSHNSVLLCRKIPCFSCFSRNKKSYERLNGTLDTLRKTNSEPCLPSELITRPIYRTEEMEFVVQLDATPLDIMDWNIFMPPFHGSLPRIHFIAFLDKKSDEYKETSSCISLTDSLNVIGEQSNAGSNTICSSGLSPVLVSNLCNKIAHRRGHPWEILYECTLYDFYDIAFAWSQNALFDIDGKAVVKMMKVITLPEKFFIQLGDSNSLQRSVSPALSSQIQAKIIIIKEKKRDKMNIIIVINNGQFFGGEWGMNSPPNSLSPEPLSLLELLYEREHSYIMDKDDYRNFHYSSALSLCNNNDSALHHNHRLEFPVLPSFQLSVDVPNNGCFEYITKPNSYRSRISSVSLERVQTVFSEAAPFYVRYLKEQNKMSKWLSRLLFKFDLTETLISICCVDYVKSFMCYRVVHDVGEALT
ncbi:unnamed protein product [Cercopithifilaria johnstoni]|uniref:Uncharacterized protein n=1 Tax=Cercopithifilaria johnstoni TaxID=2874296 RepID=A0A8J2LVI9_9BILA|nr:unnamed protein product [Cercopithifilaria johnstoni]